MYRNSIKLQKHIIPKEILIPYLKINPVLLYINKENNDFITNVMMALYRCDIVFWTSCFSHVSTTMKKDIIFAPAAENLHQNSQQSEAHVS